MAVSKTRSRRPRGTLGREQVMRAALTVADRNGLAELTMAGVANELGVPGASVYRHSGRADLMEGLADVVLGDETVIELPGQAGNAGAYLDGSTAYADDVLLIAERPGGPLRL